MDRGINFVCPRKNRILLEKEKKNRIYKKIKIYINNEKVKRRATILVVLASRKQSRKLVIWLDQFHIQSKWRNTGNNWKSRGKKKKWNKTFLMKKDHVSEYHKKDFKMKRSAFFINYKSKRDYLNLARFTNNLLGSVELKEQ